MAPITKYDKWGRREPTKREQLIDTFMYLAIGSLMLTVFFSFILLGNPHGRLEQIIVGVLMLHTEICYYIMRAITPPKYEINWDSKL